MKRYYLAIDIGASSGRHIVGWREDGKIKAKEVYRFPNGVQEQNGHLVWDVDALLSHVKAGIAAAKAEFPEIVSLSVDTWAVDYVLLRGEEEVRPVYAYRDSRTEAAIPKVHEILPFAELYAKTGCQFQPFNSIYQFYADKLTGRLEGVTDFLMIPEYLLWKLCGVKAKEYTNATTTGMVNAETGKFDPEIISALGLPPIFPKLQKPGTVLGEYEGIKCVLCATHDTASAVEGIPMDGSQPYISSGTWSLLGVKTPKPITNTASRAANYSNEGGVGYNRYQKNIMGMWLVNELQKELCSGLGFAEIVNAAQESRCDALIDANAPECLAPKRLKAAFDAVFQRYDLLLTPVAPTTAPRLGEGLADPLSLYLSDIYTVPANLAGLPALSMPCGFDRSGLPIGAQLIGPALGDLAVLDAAHAYQQETDWHRRHPDTPATAKGGDAL